VLARFVIDVDADAGRVGSGLKEEAGQGFVALRTVIWMLLSRGRRGSGVRLEVVGG